MDTEDGAVASSYVWDFFFFVFGDIFKPKFCDLKTIHIDCCVDFYVISPEFHSPNLTRIFRLLHMGHFILELQKETTGKKRNTLQSMQLYNCKLHS